MIEVERVNAGVAPPDEVPANPFAEAIDIEVTGAVPAEAAVTSHFAFTVIVALENVPTLLLTVARVRAELPGPAAVPSPVRAVMKFPADCLPLSCV